ncbi:hypothetical protein BDP27DRAFT_1413596 [Rhodocollybia butyracea]|uniref:Uncharacterized protein n=1 Tax=Rhodocollybia butyracea TaxID=206335 RepID=A0A9P5UED7_9AGAR|nr:hypothetical protein BDP27DRAFT_1413596 [Rhodocollybia butyracea]
MSGFILFVVVAIMGDVTYRRSPDDNPPQGRALYYPLAWNAFRYWLLISFMHAAMAI